MTRGGSCSKVSAYVIVILLLGVQQRFTDGGAGWQGICKPCSIDLGIGRCVSGHPSEAPPSARVGQHAFLGPRQPAPLHVHLCCTPATTDGTARSPGLSLQPTTPLPCSDFAALRFRPQDSLSCGGQDCGFDCGQTTGGGRTAVTCTGTREHCDFGEITIITTSALLDSTFAAIEYHGGPTRA